MCVSSTTLIGANEPIFAEERLLLLLLLGSSSRSTVFVAHGRVAAFNKRQVQQNEALSLFFIASFMDRGQDRGGLRGG